MDLLNKDTEDLQIIDLGNNRKEHLSESWLAAFGWWTKLLLKKMFGEEILAPVILKGTPSEINSFYQALSREKKYMQAYMDFGLNDARTIKNRILLDTAVKKFTNTTGLKWPFR